MRLANPQIAKDLEQGELIEIIVPHFSNPHYYSDPTHVRFFGLYTMSYSKPLSGLAEGR
jgi:hypothetical protein